MNKIEYPICIMLKDTDIENDTYSYIVLFSKYKYIKIFVRDSYKKLFSFTFGEFTEKDTAFASKDSQQHWVNGMVRVNRIVKMENVNVILNNIYYFIEAFVNGDTEAEKSYPQAKIAINSMYEASKSWFAKVKIDAAAELEKIPSAFPDLRAPVRRKKKNRFPVEADYTDRKMSISEMNELEDNEIVVREREMQADMFTEEPQQEESNLGGDEEVWIPKDAPF